MDLNTGFGDMRITARITPSTTPMIMDSTVMARVWPAAIRIRVSKRYAQYVPQP